MERSAQAMPSSLANFYGNVVQDVIHNLRSDFEADGVDESVLDELQTLWESKLKNANVLPADYRRPICSPKLNLNANPTYDGEGWTPTVDNVFAETPGIVNTPSIVNTPGIVNTPLQGHTPSLATPFFSPSEKHTNLSFDESRQLQADNTDSPLDYMAPPSTSREGNLFDMNVVYVENGDDMYGYSHNEPPETKNYMDLSISNKRKRDYYGSFPQMDGSGDNIWSMPLVSMEQCEERKLADEIITKNLDLKNVKLCRMISQVDGIDDNYNDHVTEEDYNLLGEEEAPSLDLKPVKEGEVESDMSEPPLNEDDDDDDVDNFDHDDQVSKSDNLVVAQFEKVTKVKGKWKCILKDGIMQLNKKDYLFSKANGEFDFF